MDKMFSKKVKIAITVIISAVILIIGIDYLKGINIMRPSNYYNITFDKVNGLTLSAPVEVDGYKVGIVKDMSYDYTSGKINVEVNLNKSVNITHGTYAELVVDVLGTAVIALHIDRTSTEYYVSGDTIQGLTSDDMMASINNDILPRLVAMIPKIDSILTGVNGFVNSPELAMSLKRIDNITANLESTTNDLSKFTSGNLNSISNNIDTASTNIKKFTSQLDQIKINEIAMTTDSALTNIKEITEKINSNTNTIGLLLNERGLYDELIHTVSSADSLLIDIKRNPKNYLNFSVFGGKKK
ncbi:MAG: MlaD family protein [Bacteroidales bacterium]